MASGSFVVSYLGVARISTRCEILAALVTTADRSYDFARVIKELITTPDCPPSTTRGEHTHHVMFDPSNGLAYFASTTVDFPSRVMFGSEAASVPGLLLEIQKTVAALGVDAIATATEGSLQGPSLVSLKKLAARFAVLASQEPRAGPGSSVLPQMHSIYFKVMEEAGSIEVEEGSGNAFHLGPILRKYSAARLVIRGPRRYTVVEFPLLFDCLGLLRSLAFDVARFNEAAAIGTSAVSASELRYACFRLTRQAAAFGVRVPRPGVGTVEVPGLQDLIAFIERMFADAITGAQSLIAGGIVDFASLSELYIPGREMLDRGLATGLFGIPTALRVRACYYSRGKSLFGVTSTFFAALEFVVCVGDRFAVIETTLPIPDFQGTRSTSEGMENLVVLPQATRAELEARGALYAGFASSAAFLEYTPGSFMPVPRAGAPTRAPARSRGGGRVMVDAQAAWVRGVHCARSEGVASDAVKGVLKLVSQRVRATAAAAASSTVDSDRISGSGQLAAAAEEESLELLLLTAPLPPALAVLTWPVVAGFSFHSKSWGVVLVSGLRKITFNEEAFRRLVMPESRKTLIEALVLSHRGSATSDASGGAKKSTHVDVMAGKGEGTIFLLHGPPGVGKTLTAEAIAELLHKPLYVVSMGELGTTPEALEERMLDILDLCIPWGSLVLIDEAEMLLERRTKNDIVRNAMVCVMLRLLEYYTGILFLTTNRVDSLDPAFQSRVQCALRYSALDASSRQRIWEDLLAHSAMKVDADVDVPALAAHELNGRQIKNVLQLAVALAQHEGSRALSQRHLDTTVAITSAFISDIDPEQPTRG